MLFLSAGTMQIRHKEGKRQTAWNLGMQNTNSEKRTASPSKARSRELGHHRHPGPAVGRGGGTGWFLEVILVFSHRRRFSRIFFLMEGAL